MNSISIKVIICTIIPLTNSNAMKLYSLLSNKPILYQMLYIDYTIFDSIPFDSIILFYILKIPDHNVPGTCPHQLHNRTIIENYGVHIHTIWVEEFNFLYYNNRYISYHNRLSSHNHKHKHCRIIY